MKRVTLRGSFVVVAAGLVGILLGAGSVAAEEEKNGTKDWDGDIAASFAAQTGSVNTLAADVDAKGERNFTSDQLTARLRANYGQTRDRSDTPSKDTTTQNAQSLRFGHKRTLSERFFWESVNETSRDTTQDREVRFVLATGPGYRVWIGEDVKKQFFDVNVGVGYRYELFDGNTGPDPEDNTVFDSSRNGYDSNLADAILAFEYRNLLFDGAMEWTHTGSISMPMNDTSAYLARTEGQMGIPLTASWDFRAGVVVEYNNNAPDDQNKVLTRSTVGLAYKF